MFCRSSVTVFLVLLLAAVPTAHAAAQSNDASSRVALRGRIVDPDGAGVAGARITVAAQGRVPAVALESGGAGEFTLLLAPGSYSITVAADGFASLTQGATVTQSDTETRVFPLRLAQVREDVTVTASGAEVRQTVSGTKTMTRLIDIPQSITIVTEKAIKEQLMLSVGDLVRYVPGIAAHQGENNRDQVIVRGNNSSADFFLNGVRDDVQYYRDLYNLDRVEALKGPNAMIFGRGGGGGVINRVTKEAVFAPVREFTVVGGSHDRKRIAADVDAPLGNSVAFRVNGMYEDAGSFRNAVGLERYGFNPTVTVMPGPNTRITAGYERFADERVADRGVPSFRNRPADVDVATYFGNPADSYVKADVNLGSAAIEHQAGGMTIRNRTSIGSYARSYQNFVPGAVSADKSLVALSAYNNATDRLNVFNQTDVTSRVSTRGVGHVLLAGAEIGRQATDNLRHTGYFNGVNTSVSVPYAAPLVSEPVTFRQSATDADNHVTTNLAAAYVQDQVELSRHVQALAGVRVDRFDLQYHNNRTGDILSRVDTVLSPRAGIVVKPRAPLSLYGSYAVSFLPSAGDQFSSLTTITQQVRPERFNNYEVGAKWDVHPDLSLTTAVYRLDRTNTRSTDPNDPTRIVQTGSQRTNGWELGADGNITAAWRVAGGYAYQDAFVTSATVSARAGARVAQVPRHMLSLWNMYAIRPRVGAGIGVVHRTDVFAAIDNTVVLPGYTNVDAALYVSLSRRLRLQAHIENVFDRTYYVNADSNTNISPGSPRALKMALIARF